MNITVLTLFPEMFTGFLSNSIIKRAIGKGLVKIDIVDIRAFAMNKDGRVDAPPVGGGAGLIMKCPPLIAAIEKCARPGTRKILLSPRGRIFDQKKARKLAKRSSLLFIAGHYEGIDERVRACVDEEISLGDFIMTGGEPAAVAMIDAIVRLLPGAITAESLDEESFTKGLLEYPQYAEPYDWEGRKVPLILYSGHHEAIAKYRQKEALVLTRTRRPDLFRKYHLTPADEKLLEEHDAGIEEPDWLKKALIKGHKFTDKD